MKETIQLTKLASCGGCGAKVGAGVLAKLLADLPTRSDPNLLVGFDRSDDASVYQISEDCAIVQTLDFFPPIVDDPFLFGQIAATNALSDVYAMGAEPKLALNIMTVTKQMKKQDIHEILRGGYEKAYEAGTIITGGHTIEDETPKYGLSVTGFVHPKRVLTNAKAEVGDVLLLTKPLGVGLLTSAERGGLLEEPIRKTLYEQMCLLNKIARDEMVKFPVHSCTDVTGFSLLGHSYEMAMGSDKTIVLKSAAIPYHKEALEFAKMGLVPAGTYKNKEFAKVKNEAGCEEALLDVFYDPQTSGGLLIALPEASAIVLERHLQQLLPCAQIVGYVEESGEDALILR